MKKNENMQPGPGPELTRRKHILIHNYVLDKQKMGMKRKRFVFRQLRGDEEFLPYEPKCGIKPWCFFVRYGITIGEFSTCQLISESNKRSGCKK